MNKRGNINFDIFLVIIILFAFIITMVFSYYVWIQINNKFQNMDNIDADVKAIINDFGKWFLFLDKIVPFLFIALWFCVFLSSLLVNPEHPAFFIVNLIVIFFFTIVVIIFVDFGQRLFSNVLLVAVSSQLSNSMFFINNLHFISFFVMLFSSVWFYVRGRNIDYTR